jgi:hypothetical protein
MRLARDGLAQSENLALPAVGDAFGLATDLATELRDAMPMARVCL